MSDQKNIKSMPAGGHRQRKRASAPIADDLRRQCIGGKLTPGMRLPRREELIRHYSASATTVQQAIDELVADGLLDARGRAGTFIAENPRHLTDVALVFPARCDDPFNWRHFYDVLAANAAMWRGDRLKRFHIYCCPLKEEASDDLSRLHDDIRKFRLNGVIHITREVNKELSHWQTKYEVPVVYVVPSHMQETGSVPMVQLSYDSFFSRAIEFMAGHGRRRIAIVLNPDMYFQIEHEHIDREAARFGVEIRPEWRQFVGLGTPVCARSVTHLLMTADPLERPDCLIIADDNMVSHAIQGLNDSGLRAGHELDMIVHGNFPNSSPFEGIRITRLGFDSRAILDAGVRLLDAWREKGENAEFIELDAVFEDELWSHHVQ
jgi:DNA-binding LacI/PurR family transcriptional regulator